MISADASSNKIGDWSYLGRELKRRTFQPCRDFPFVVYVLLAIIGLGCLGIWVELFLIARAEEPVGYDGVLTALATFFPALIGASSLQLILSSTGQGDKVLVSFGFLISILAFASVVLISVFKTSFPAVAFWSAVGFALLAVWLWWFTNGDDPTYKSGPVDAPSGGDPNRPAKGDTSGYKE